MNQKGFITSTAAFVVGFMAAISLVMLSTLPATPGSKLLGAAQGQKPPSIDAISPTAGPLGSLLTIAGSGFTAQGNDIEARGKVVLSGLASVDSIAITFTLPLATPCTENVICPIKVVNANGISNAVMFTVITPPPPPPPPPPAPTQTPPPPPPTPAPTPAPQPQAPPPPQPPAPPPTPAPQPPPQPQPPPPSPLAPQAPAPLPAPQSPQPKAQQQIQTPAAQLPPQAAQPPKISSLSPGSGPLGTTITILGSGFDATGNKIFVRGHIIAEDLSSSDGATITYVLLNDSTCGIGEACPIKVITSNGISNAVPFKITAAGITPPPPPELTATTTPPQAGQGGFVTVLAPNGGEIWYKDGKAREIRWSTSNVPPNWTATVRLAWAPLEFGNYLELFTDIVNDGSELWNIPKIIVEGRDHFITVLVCNQAKTQCHEDTSDNAFKIYTLPPEVVPATLPNGNVSQSYSVRIGAREGLPPLTWSIAGGALPAGLMLTSDAGAGLISGIPTSAGTSTFTAQVTDANGFSDTEVFSIAVTGPCATSMPQPAGYISYDTCSDQEPAVIRRSNGDLVVVFNSGGSGLAVSRGAVSHDNGATWSGPQFAVSAWDDLSIAEGPGGTLVLLAWMNQSPYNIGLSTLTSSDGVTWSSGRRVTPTEANNSVGRIIWARDGYYYASYHTFTSAATPVSDTMITRSRDLATWEPPVRATDGVERSNDSSILQAADGTFWLAYYVFPTTTHNGGVVIQKSADAKIWSRVAFIPGLGPNHGAVNLIEVNGKPAVFGRMGYSTYYSYPRGDGTWATPVKVLDNTPFGGEATVLADGTVGLAYTYIANLATDPYGQRDIRFANVGAIAFTAPLVITTSSFPDGTIGVAYTASTTASGGLPPYLWSIASGSLPTGLTLNPSTGMISGVPTAAGTATFTLRVTDSESVKATKTFSITIQVPPVPPPTNIRAGWGITRDNTNQSSLYFHAINFTVTEPYPSALRVYLKKPGESAFARAAEFTAAQFTEASPCSKIVTSGSTSYTSWWTMFRFCNSNGWKIDSYLRPASGYPEGEYQFYLASVDAAGHESVTPTFGMYNLAPLTILSPTSSQSPVAAKPTFQWTVSRGWPTSPAPYTIYIYDQANFAMSKEVHIARVDVSTASTTGTYVYDGPALDAAKKYRVLMTGLKRAASPTMCPSCDYISMDAAPQTFWISAPTVTVVPIAPTRMRADLQSSNPPGAPTTLVPRIIFNYSTTTISQHAVTSFRLYAKLPGETAFTRVAEFTDLPLTRSASDSVRTAFGPWKLIPTVGGADWLGFKVNATGAYDYQPTTSYPSGPHSYYVTAVNAAGESQPSEVATEHWLGPLTVLAPKQGEVLATTTPTFKWTIASGWPFTPPHTVYLIEESKWGSGLATWAKQKWSWDGSLVYDGPPLDPSKRYMAFVSGRAYMNDTTSYFSHAAATVVFSIASSTTLTTTPPPPPPPPASAPTLTGITPMWGYSGTQVTLTGSGFTLTNNTVTFAEDPALPPASVTGVASSDGLTLTLPVPANLPCSEGEACSVTVKNANGTSNGLSFKRAYTLVPVKVWAPNGGETVTQGISTTLHYSGGNFGLYVGIAKETATMDADPSSQVLGWIWSTAPGDRSIGWDGKSLCGFPGCNATTTRWTIGPGRYKAVALSHNELGHSMFYDPETGKLGNFDLSDQPFSVVAPTASIQVTYPNGGETWMQQTKPSIKWNASNITGNTATINLLKAGAYYRTIAGQAPQSSSTGSFSYVWVIPTDIPPASDYQIEIVHAGDPNVRDRSDGMFTIVPMPETVTIRGRIIDIKTGQPVANTTIRSFSSTNGTTFTTGADGTFAVSASTAPILSGSFQAWFTSRGCYLTLGNGFLLGRQTDGSLRVSVDPFDAGGQRPSYPILGQEVSIGDHVIWPVASMLYVHSDVLMKYMVEYPEEGRGAGIGGLVYSGASSGLIPLDYNVRLRMTDANNQTFYSPYTKLPLSHGCSPITLRYQKGQFTWEPLSLTVLAPNGGEMWPAGTTQAVTWKSSGLPFDALTRIELRDPVTGSGLATLSTTTAVQSGRFDWNIPSGYRTGSYHIRVEPYMRPGGGVLFTPDALKVADVSDAPFEITSSGAPPAPTGGSEAGGYFGANNEGFYSLGLRFYYDAASLSQVQSFRLYQKAPGDSSFNLAATFDNPAPLLSSCGGIYTTTWELQYSCGGRFWFAASRPGQRGTYFAVGEYSYYVTAVNSTGVEGAPSPTFREYVLKPTRILSPTSAQSPVSTSPTISWTVTGGWPSAVTPSYRIVIYDAQTKGQSPIYVRDVPVSPSLSQYSYLYDGPALDPTKRYAILIDAEYITWGTSPRVSYLSMVENLETFWISP